MKKHVNIVLYCFPVYMLRVLRYTREMLLLRQSLVALKIYFWGYDLAFIISFSSFQVFT